MRRQFKNPYRYSLLLPVITIAILALTIYYAIAYEADWTYDWDGIRTEIRDSTRLIADADFISSGVIGYFGTKPDQFDRRFWVMKNATTEELLRLTDYPNGTVKAVAYEGLIRYADGLEFESIMSALAESEHIYFYAGCDGESMQIGEYIVKTFVGHDLDIPRSFPPITSSSWSYEFSNEEKGQIKEACFELINNR